MYKTLYIYIFDCVLFQVVYEPPQTLGTMIQNTLFYHLAYFLPAISSSLQMIVCSLGLKLPGIALYITLLC